MSDRLPEPPPDPVWGPAARSGYESAGRSMLGAYEDAAVRRVLAILGLPGLAPEIAQVVADAGGGRGCTFAAFDERVGFPIRFGTGKIKNVKFLALPDLFDRFTRSPLFEAMTRFARESEAADGRPLGLIFPYTGDSTTPGPKGGKFMTLHTFASTPILDTTRIVRPGRLGRQSVVFTLETLESLLASFRGWGDEFTG